ncbi:MAG: carboxypeptidase-like regulatory domain-containing protein [Chitinophagaceae bacterium]|nr:carboxypeptidase-like regulatory domain-containing protein [Chitinophagaceae bacterium]
MKLVHRISLTAFCLFIIVAGNAQQQVNGTVYDAATNSPLAFVNITVKHPTTGTTSDIDGRFLLNNISGNSTLTVSHVGYRETEITIVPGMPMPIRIYVERTGNELNNVVILPGENPAHRIIRLLQQNKKQHDPARITSFKYNAYTVASLGSGDYLWNMNNDSAFIKQTKNKKQPVVTDSAKLKLEQELVKRFRNNYLFITESYTERIFRYPKQTKETVLATKVSGIQSPVFAMTSSNFQPFGFYGDYLQLGDKAYVNPLINGSIGMYKFRLKDTRLNGTDTTFVISYEPLKGKLFNGLKGMLYINSNGYAIENVTAAAADEKGLIMRYRLQQKYENINGQWFPQQLNSTISQTDVKKDSVLLYWDSRSYISNIQLGQQFSNADFSDIILDYHPKAGKRSAVEWNTFRKDSLSQREKETYQTYKLLPAGILNTFEKLNSLIEIIALQAMPWGKVDIPFKYFLSGINKYESFRAGGGFQTNALLNKTFSIGGYAGYGVRDKAWKYGGNLLLKLHQRTATHLQLSYSRDLEEPGNTDYFVRNGSIFSSQSLRNFFTSRMDSVQQYRFDVTTKLKPWLQTDIWFLNEKRNPAAYAWEYKNAGTNETYRNYRNTEIGIGMRFTSGENFAKIGRAKIAFNPPVTQLLLQVSKGLDHFMNGQLNYTKLALQFNHSIRFKKLGQAFLQIEAGQVFGDVPYAYLFNTKASKVNNSLSLFIPNTFQTVGLYEFAADRTASIFIQHKFGNLLFKPANVHFRPEFILAQNISFGSLTHPAYQNGIGIKTASKGLYESGLLINNIYRMDSRFCYLGFGAGVFYRYGPYRLAKTAANLALKIGINLSF